MPGKNTDEFVPSGEEFDENVMLNPDYYTHKIIDRIIEAPEKNPNMMVIYVNMLEKVLVSRKLIDEEKSKDIDKKVKEELERIQKDIKDIDKRVLMIMKFNIRFQHLLEIDFSSRPLEDSVRI